LFLAIESSCKGYSGLWGSIKKEIGSGVKEARELLNLSCLMNFGSERTPLKPHPIMNLKLLVGMFEHLTM
jgi:hypothetical protein